MKKYLLAGLLLASSTLASAASFGFSVSGTFDGTLYGYDADNNAVQTEFTDQAFTLTGLFNAQPTVGEIAHFDTFKVTTGGQEFDLGDLSSMYLETDDDENFYMSFGSGEAIYLGFTFSLAEDADQTAIPVSFYDHLLDYQMTLPAGTYSFTAGRDMTLSPIVQGVPEPATWGMMALGFGLVGHGLRRRRSDAVAA